MKTLTLTLIALAAMVSTTMATAQTSKPDPMHKSEHAMMKMAAISSAFKGIEVNGGTVSINKMEGKTVLTLSSDFMSPKSPAPHWQVVDSKGNVYLLNQLRIAGDKENRMIVLPSYVRDVAKVQIWCSFAEVVLGEATFQRAVKL